MSAAQHLPANILLSTCSRALDIRRPNTDPIQSFPFPVSLLTPVFRPNYSHQGLVASEEMIGMPRLMPPAATPFA